MGVFRLYVHIYIMIVECLMFVVSLYCNAKARFQEEKNVKCSCCFHSFTWHALFKSKVSCLSRD